MPLNMTKNENKKYIRNYNGDITHVDLSKEERYKLYSPKAEKDGRVLKHLFSCGITVADPTYYCHFFHAHHACVMYFLSGSGELSVDDTIYTIQPGDVVLMREGHEWEYKTDPSDPWALIWLNLEQDTFFSLFDFYDIPPVSRFNAPDLGFTVQNTVQLIRDNQNTAQTLDAVMVNILHLVQHISRHISEKKIKKRQVQVATSVMDYINLHIMEPLRISDMAANMFLSDCAVSNAFRALYNCSIKEYILRSKLEIAARLLREGELDIHEIAEQLSFCDTQHFSRMFKKYHNVSPAKYRSMFYSKPRE